MVGDRDRPEPARPRLGEQHLDRASRSRRSGRCACAGRRRSAAARRAGPAAGVARASWRRATSPRRPPRARRPRAATRAGRRSALAPARGCSRSAGSAIRRAQVGGQRLRVAGLEHEPALALGQQLLVDRQPRGDRHDAGAERAHAASPASAGCPRRRAPATSAAGEQPAASSSPGVDERDALAQQPRSSVAGGASGRGDQTVACQARSGGSSRSARRKVRSAARSSRRRSCTSSDASVGSRGPRRAGGSAPGRDHPVVAGEVALQQVAGGAVAGGPGVEAANSSRDSGRVSWVERIRSVGAWKLPTLSAREWRSATLEALGRERLVHVDDVERQRGQRLLDRPRDVDRERAARRRVGRERQHLADAEHERLASPRARAAPRVARGSPGGCRGPARRLRRGDDQDAVAAAARARRRPRATYR